MEKTKEKLQNLEKNKCCPCTRTVEWPNLEAEMRNCVMDHRHNRISMFSKVIIFKEEIGAYTCVSDFIGLDL
jgi:hypothetical protein